MNFSLLEKKVFVTSRIQVMKSNENNIVTQLISTT